MGNNDQQGGEAQGNPFVAPRGCDFIHPGALLLWIFHGGTCTLEKIRAHSDQRVVLCPLQLLSALFPPNIWRVRTQPCGIAPDVGGGGCREQLLVLQRAGRYLSQSFAAADSAWQRLRFALSL